MKIINIKFRKTKKVYPFLINEFQNFQKGDHVIVDTIRGEQIGIVLGVANKLGMELEENDEVKIREVKRKLTEKEVPYELQQFTKDNLSDNFLNNLFYFTFVFKYCK